MKISAFYIDGKTSRRRACEVNLGSNSITITYVDDGGYGRSIMWKPENILKVELLTSSTTLKHGSFPHEVLEFASAEDFQSVLKKYPHASFHQSNYNKFKTFGWKGIGMALTGVIVFSILFLLYGAPFIADLFARSISTEYESYIGHNLRETYLQYFEVDSAQSEKMQQFFDELNYESEYDISVLVVNTDQVNAFALPGGYIVVFSGIIDMIDDENELAALLAHEASHINERHSLRAISRDLSTYLLISALTGDVYGFSSVIIENSNMISSLSFSRKFEKEADLEGLELMISSNIDPVGMIELFEKFQSVNDSVKTEFKNSLSRDSSSMSVELEEVDTTDLWESIPWEKVYEVLSTHPSPKNRIEYLRQAVSEADLTTNSYANDNLRLYYEELKE